MRFRQKIWMLPLSATIVFAIGVAVSFFIGSRTSAVLDHLAKVDSPTLAHVQQLERSIESFRLMLQGAVAEGDAERLNDVKVYVDRARSTLASLAAIPQSKAISEELGRVYEAYQSSALAASKAMLGQGDPGNTLAAMQANQVQLDKQVQQALKKAAEAVEVTSSAAQSGVREAQWLTVITGLVVLTVLGVASHLIVSSVWRELGNEPNELQRLVRAIAEGDLRIRTQVKAQDSSSLNASIAEMVDQLGNTVGTIRLAADSIAVSSREIAAGSQDLSQRTESASSNLQATSSSVDALTGSVHNSAESASQANSMAVAAAEAARRGGGIVTQAMANMDEINNASRRIGEITGVIDGIAFQTNILALNAAVEAARAGEQGRGFAVVAAEVRNLAQRSAEAAKEIKALIGASSEKVDSGSRLVHEAGAAMQQIMVSVQRVSDVIGEISTATQEQSRGIGKVNQAVSELDQMTQQNAALVEQSAAAAASMREQAVKLTASVASFRTV